MSSPLKKISLLIIDDSPLVKKRIEELLDGMDTIKQLFFARTFPEGLSLIEIYLPEVILLDLNLSSGNGLKNLQYLKEFYSSIKVIVITNQAFEEYARLSLSLGADYFLDKSYDFQKLPSVIYDLSNTEDPLPPAS